MVYSLYTWYCATENTTLTAIENTTLTAIENTTLTGICNPENPCNFFHFFFCELGPLQIARDSFGALHLTITRLIATR